MEISALRDEIKPKEKRVRHILELDNERATRVASSFLAHQKFLSGRGNRWQSPKVIPTR